MSKLKYKPSDFKELRSEKKKIVTCQVTETEYARLNAAAEYLNTSMSKLTYKCLSDAGVFGETKRKKEDVDSQPDPGTEQEEDGAVQDELPI